ncbi:MAG: PP2C family protein-serine/threonine phosphatase [Phycisphaerales bacterium]
MAEGVFQCMEVWGGSEAADTGVEMPGVDVWVMSRPFQGDDAGGDVHYVSSCATGRVTRFLLADVSGHGEAVASVARDLRTLMRRFVNYIDQGRFVRELNREFNELAEAGCFATAIVATYFNPTGHLTLCNAGHPRPLVFSRETGRWNAIDIGKNSRVAGNLPLGIFAGVEYDEGSLVLAPGDCVLLYTDALVEAVEAGGIVAEKRGLAMVGERGLLEMLEGLDPEDLGGLVRGLQERLFARVGELKDDATVLAIRVNAGKQRTSLGDRVIAAGRWVRLWMRGEATNPVPWPEWSVVNIVGGVIGPVNRWFRPRAGKLPNEQMTKLPNEE